MKSSNKKCSSAIAKKKSDRQVKWGERDACLFRLFLLKRDVWREQYSTEKAERASLPPSQTSCATSLIRVRHGERGMDGLSLLLQNKKTLQALFAYSVSFYIRFSRKGIFYFPIAVL